MDETDEARAYLKTLMGSEYKEYIDEKLAGDFAYDIVKMFKLGHTCAWLDPDGYGPFWDTECGNTVVMDLGTPAGSGYEFCPFCGGTFRNKAGRE